MADQEKRTPTSSLGELRREGAESQRTLSHFRDHLRRQARSSADPEWARMRVGEEDAGHMVWRVDADGEETLTYEPGTGADERHWVWTWEDDEWLPEEAD